MSVVIRLPDGTVHSRSTPSLLSEYASTTQSKHQSFISQIRTRGLARKNPNRRCRTQTILAVSAACIVSTILLIVISLSVCLTITGKCGLDRPNEYEKLASESYQSLTESAWTPSNTTKQNGVMFQAFEWYMLKDSKHWVRLKNQLGKLEAIGVNNIWIPPPSKNANSSLIGYDIYDLWDLGEFDQVGQIPTGMGTKDELLDLANTAQLYGIGITADAVLNQRGGADKVVSCEATVVNDQNRFQPISEIKSIDAWVGFEFPGRGGKYSTKTWSCEDFTAVDYDAHTNEQGIFKLQGKFNHFAEDVSKENGNYDYLLLADVAYQNPSVQADVKAWGWWITRTLNLRGFRLDAVKHVSRGFILDFMENIKMHRIDGTDLFYASEFWTSNTSLLREYVQQMEYRVSVFDTPLVTNLAKFSTGELTDLREIFNGSYVAEDPDHAVTFVSSHDTQLSQAIQQYNIAGWFLPVAYSLILLRSAGYPTIFYGDIYGMFDSTGVFSSPPYAVEVANLALARKFCAYGNQMDYFDDPDLVGWTRLGTEDRKDGLAVVIRGEESAKKSKRMNVGARHGGETWTDILDATHADVTIDSDGWAEFQVEPRSVSVYTNKCATWRDNFGKWDATIYGSHA